MSLEVLIQISYGAPDRTTYKLKVGNIVPDDFFLPIEREKALERKMVKETPLPPNIHPEGEKKESLPDLSKLKVVEVKEFLEEEFNVANLLRYFDQESSRNTPRKKLLAWIEKKVNELTEFEPARVK